MHVHCSRAWGVWSMKIHFLHKHHKAPNLISICPNPFLIMFSMDYIALILTVSSQLSILDLGFQKFSKFSLTFFSKFLQAQSLFLDSFIILSCYWSSLDVETEEFMAFEFMFNVWSFHGKWRLSKIQEHLSLHFIIIHLKKHVGRRLKHCQAWKHVISSAAHQEVTFSTSLILKIVVPIV